MPGRIVSVTLLLLAAIAGYWISVDRVGPDPAKWLLHKAGFWTLVFLCLTLAMSTLRRLLRKPVFIAWRRPLGLAAFALACAHLVVYLTVYQGLDVSAIVDDIGKRPYIMIGMTAWILLLPMALTSTRNARRRLGARWTMLHRAIYLVVPLGIIHQGMAQKADLGQTLVFSACAGCFLIERWLASRGLLPWSEKRA